MVVVSGSDYQTSGSDDYPQTPLSLGQSQKSSTSFSTNKESQSEFDYSDNRLQTTERDHETDALSIRSLERSPQGSGYNFMEDKHEHAQDINVHAGTNPALQSTAPHDGLSRELGSDEDEVLPIATEATPSTRESEPSSHKQLSRKKTFPISSTPNKIKEQMFASKLCHSLTQCQQPRRRWSTSADSDSSEYQGVKLETKQEIITIRNLNVSPEGASAYTFEENGPPGSMSSPACAQSNECTLNMPITSETRISASSKPLMTAPRKEIQPSVRKLNLLPESNTTTSDDGISSLPSCQVEPALHLVLPCHPPGLSSQSSLYRSVLSRSQLVKPTNRDSLDSGYVGDSKCSSSAISNCSTPDSMSPRSSFSQQSQPKVASSHSSMVQQERMVSPLANVEECSLSATSADPDTANSESALAAPKSAIKRNEPIYQNILHPMDGVRTEQKQNGENESDMCIRQQICEEEEATRRQMTRVGEVCQDKRLHKRQRLFREKYSQQSDMLSKESTGQPDTSLCWPPANTDAATIRTTEPTIATPAITLTTSKNTHGSSEARAGTTTSINAESTRKVKLLCRPLQSRRRSCEIAVEEGSNSLTIVYNDQSEESNEVNRQENGEAGGHQQSSYDNKKPANLSSGRNKPDLLVENGRGQGASPVCTPKLDEEKCTAPCSSTRNVIDSRKLAQFSEENSVTGMQADLARQYSTGMSSYESESTLCPSSLDPSRCSTLDRNKAQMAPDFQYTTFSLKSNASGRSNISGRSDPGYQTDQENSTPVTTPMLCPAPLQHCHLELAEHGHQQIELSNITEHVNTLPCDSISDEDLTPTEKFETSESVSPDFGYGTCKHNGIIH